MKCFKCQTKDFICYPRGNRECLSLLSLMVEWGETGGEDA